MTILSYLWPVWHLGKDLKLDERTKKNKLCANTATGSWSISRQMWATSKSGTGELVKVLFTWSPETSVHSLEGQQSISWYLPVEVATTETRRSNTLLPEQNGQRSKSLLPHRLLVPECPSLCLLVLGFEIGTNFKKQTLRKLCWTKAICSLSSSPQTQDSWSKLQLRLEPSETLLRKTDKFMIMLYKGFRCRTGYNE